MSKSADTVGVKDVERAQPMVQVGHRVKVSTGADELIGLVVSVAEHGCFVRLEPEHRDYDDVIGQPWHRVLLFPRQWDWGESFGVDEDQPAESADGAVGSDGESHGVIVEVGHRVWAMKDSDCYEHGVVTSVADDGCFIRQDKTGDVFAAEWASVVVHTQQAVDAGEVV